MQIIVSHFVYIEFNAVYTWLQKHPDTFKALLGLNVSKYEGCFIYLITISCHFPPSTWLVS